MKLLTYIVYISVSATPVRTSYNTVSWQWAVSIDAAKKQALAEYPARSYVTNAILAP